MNRKIILMLFFFIIPIYNAYAACQATTKTYTACKPGYYLSAGTCVACPESGTSADKNNSGITDCYIPADTTITDETGEYTYISDCYYVD